MPNLKTWRCIVDLEDEDRKRDRVIVIVQCNTSGQAQGKIYYIFGSSRNVEAHVIQITELKGSEQGLLFAI